MIAVGDTHHASAQELVAGIAAGRLSAETVWADCRKHAESRNADIHAWVSLAEQPGSLSSKTGPLYGLPIGVKDVISTATLPTRYGTDLPLPVAGLLPVEDAECVAQLLEAGALILGKTVTSELATYSPGPTRNPAGTEHTPGGSSSGSAAAVADGQVPVALGTQTAGSVIRPASFCGVYGYKPTLGRYSRQGVLRTSATLDTLGLFARCVEDLLLIDAVLSPAKDTREPAQSTADFALRLYRGPHWSRADAATQTAVEAFFAAACPLASSVGETDTPPSVLELSKAQETVHAVEVSQELGNFADANPGDLSTAFLTMVAEGRALAGAAYRESMQAIERARTELDSWLHEGEVLITPAAIGCAPQGLHSTGDPLFCRDWTALGLPAVCLPLPRVAGQLPLGVQLVARPGSDRWLLRVVQQLSQRLTDSRNPATV